MIDYILYAIKINALTWILYDGASSCGFKTHPLILLTLPWVIIFPAWNISWRTPGETNVYLAKVKFWNLHIQSDLRKQAFSYHIDSALHYFQQSCSTTSVKSEMYHGPSAPSGIVLWGGETAFKLCSILTFICQINFMHALYFFLEDLSLIEMYLNPNYILSSLLIYEISNNSAHIRFSVGWDVLYKNPNAISHMGLIF